MHVQQMTNTVTFTLPLLSSPTTSISSFDSSLMTFGAGVAMKGPDFST